VHAYSTAAGLTAGWGARLRLFDGRSRPYIGRWPGAGRAVGVTVGGDQLDEHDPDVRVI
jgi:hypothetical protein